MLTATEERYLNYIEERANENVRGRRFSRMTDVLEEAFLLTRDEAYETIRDIMSRKNIGNSKYDVIDEYLDMLKHGYISIQRQMELFGGDKFSTVAHTAARRSENYKGGSIFKAMEEIYCIKEEEVMPVLEKYFNKINAAGFEFQLNMETFNKFLEEDPEELDKQFERYRDL